MSNLIKRTVPVIFVLAICISCLVFPAAASSFEVPSTFIDILDYATPDNNSGTSTFLTVNDTVIFDVPDDLSFNNVDIVFFSSQSIQSVSIGSHVLKLYALNSGLYRAYGAISDGTSSGSISLNFSNNRECTVNFVSFKAYDSTLTPESITGSFDVFINGTSRASLDQSEPSKTVTFNFDSVISSAGHSSIVLDLYSDYWKPYDYLAIRFRTDVTIDSIECMSADGQIPIPYTSSIYYSYPNYSEYEDHSHYHYIIMDVSSLRNYNSYPVLQVAGHLSTEAEGIFYFYDVTGFIDVYDVDPNLSFFRKFGKTVSDHLNSIFSKLEHILVELKILNGSDSGGLSAQQKQEAINVSVNNQLVGAVEDWNTNIEVVQAGYDTALTNVTPSLIWLSSLADGIFNGMGWFGSIYFLVGLISVIMLVLSKSGLAHKIGNISRRGD